MKKMLVVVGILLTLGIAQPVMSSRHLAEGNVGERVVAGGVALTVNATQRLAIIIAPGRPPLTPTLDGHEYIVVDVTIENVERDWVPYNPLFFTVRDSDGYEYVMDSEASFMSPRPLRSGELARGDKVRGTVVFQVPKRKGLLLIYKIGDYQIRVRL